MDPTIEFHESEYFHSALSDQTLRLVALFVDRECYDRLLYEGDKYVRLHHKRIRSLFPLRIKSYSGRYGSHSLSKDAKGQEEDTPIFTMAHNG